MLQNSVLPSVWPFRCGILMPYSTLANAIVLLYDISVCQLCPASDKPIGLPLSSMFDRIMICGRPGSWYELATLISSLPKRALKSTNCCAVSCCLGKRNTPCAPSAWRTAVKSVSASGCARFNPVTVAPSVFPLAMISSTVALPGLLIPP